MNLEEILQKAQQKAQKLANKAGTLLQRGDFNLNPDDLERKLLDRLLRTNNVEVSHSIVPCIRLNSDFIKEIYQKLSIKPGKSKYWFLPKCDLVQIDRLDNPRVAATPIAALCLLARKEILEEKKIVPEYIKNNSQFVDLPSNQWQLGQISQLIDLSCSYILGFNTGYDNNTFETRCATEYQYGYEDGLKIRNLFLSEKLIDPDIDFFENENDPEKIAELCRIGYYHETDETKVAS